MSLLNKLFRCGSKRNASEENPRPFCTAIIVAAGRASRMEGIDKVLFPLAGTPLLLYTLKPFQLSPLVDEIVVVTREDLLVSVGTYCSREGLTKVRRIVKGGENRASSVLAGLREADKRADLIAIHDGARPFLPGNTLEEVLKAGRLHGAAAPALPVKDTIKMAQDGVVQNTPDRSVLFAVQTPQVFETGLIKGALAHALDENAELTDDCSAVERIGFPVHLTQGSESNFKVTTPADLLRAEALLAERMGR